MLTTKEISEIKRRAVRARWGVGPEATQARFWKNVDKEGPTMRPELGPCWQWIRSVTSSGYGNFCADGKYINAHRYSRKLHNGNLTQWTLHRCDNRRCVRPDHLFEGDAIDNERDKNSKGRGVKGRPLSKERIIAIAGENNHSAKLDWVKVEEIRSLRTELSQRQLAFAYGVTVACINAVINGKSWKPEYAVAV